MDYQDVLWASFFVRKAYYYSIHIISNVFVTIKTDHFVYNRSKKNYFDNLAVM